MTSQYRSNKWRDLSLWARIGQLVALTRGRSNFNSNRNYGFPENVKGEPCSAKRVVLGVQKFTISMFMRMNSDFIRTDLEFCCIDL